MKIFFQLGTILLVVVAGWLVLDNQSQIRDWWILRSYDPPDYVVAYADDTSMSQEGRDIFYVSKPLLNNKDEFNQNCNFEERSIILGCYTDSQIYIYDVEEPRLSGVEEVTAAHEMLHAAYARLQGGDKDKVDQLLAEQLASITDTRILELVEQYRKDDPSNLNNEIHSIFGTELRDLSPGLEEHYGQYFQDRLQVVAISESYEQVFVDIKSQIENLEKEVGILKIQISDSESTINALQVEIDAESARLESLKESGDVPGYNAGVPNFNALVARYNTQVDTYKSLIAQHNEKVDQRNQLATDQNELIYSLDSKYESL